MLVEAYHSSASVLTVIVLSLSAAAEDYYERLNSKSLKMRECTRMGKKRQGKKGHGCMACSRESRDKCHKAKCGRMTKVNGEAKNQCGSEKERMKAQK
jgi:hypothetical protein